MLKTTVLSSNEDQLVNIREPAKKRTNEIITWSKDCPIIIFHILKVIIEACFGSGFRRSNDEVGGSVARANAANVSWTRLSHNSCTTVRTDCSCALATEETNAITTALTVTVS